MLILGIESSCDDTSVALIKADKCGFAVLSEKTASQIDVHKKYGGVVPEIAGRKHAEKIMPLIEEVLSGIKPNVIAVTAGPGLITGLMVGVEAARALSYLWNIPVVAVNHIEGHIHSVEVKNNPTLPPPSKRGGEVEYPTLALIASGGHTELIYIKKQGDYKLVGATRDDAAGECFDKVAKLLGFDYPGGPKISEHALAGNTKAINFPRPMLRENNYDFSFAGLKTSALYWLRDNQTSHTIGSELLAQNLNDFCASFEQAIIDVLVGKTINAAKKLKPKSIILAGGVSANKKLKESLQEQIAIQSPISNFLFPISSYSMDNASMIAVAGYYHAIKKDFTPWKKLTANPNWKIYTKQLTIK